MSNLRLMSALWGEMKVTTHTPHTGKQFFFHCFSMLLFSRVCRECLLHLKINKINSAISRALLPLFDVCSVSGPPRFVSLIACISIQQCQGRSARRRVIECHGGMQGEEGRGGRR